MASLTCDVSGERSPMTLKSCFDSEKETGGDLCPLIA